MYILYNHDGSINKKMLNEFIQQGNSYANALFVAIIDIDPSEYALTGIATLPNGDNVTIQGGESTSLVIDGVSRPGKYLSLTNAVTSIPGSIKINVSATSGATVLATYTVVLTINETGLQSTDPVQMTVAEYQNLIESLNNLGSPQEIVSLSVSDGHPITLTDEEYALVSKPNAIIKDANNNYYYLAVETQDAFIFRNHNLQSYPQHITGLPERYSELTQPYLTINKSTKLCTHATNIFESYNKAALNDLYNNYRSLNKIYWKTSYIKYHDSDAAEDKYINFYLFSETQNIEDHPGEDDYHMPIDDYIGDYYGPHAIYLQYCPTGDDSEYYNCLGVIRGVPINGVGYVLIQYVDYDGVIHTDRIKSDFKVMEAGDL